MDRLHSCWKQSTVQRKLRRCVGFSGCRPRFCGLVHSLCFPLSLSLLPSPSRHPSCPLFFCCVVEVHQMHQLFGLLKPVMTTGLDLYACVLYVGAVAAARQAEGSPGRVELAAAQRLCVIRCKCGWGHSQLSHQPVPICLPTAAGPAASLGVCSWFGGLFSCCCCGSMRAVTSSHRCTCHC